MKKGLFTLALLAVMLVMVAGCAPGTCRTSQYACPEHTRYARSQRSNQRARRNHTSQCARPEPDGQHSRCARSRRRHPAGTLARDHLPGDPRAVIRQPGCADVRSAQRREPVQPWVTCSEWHSCLSILGATAGSRAPIARTAALDPRASLPGAAWLEAVRRPSADHGHGPAQRNFACGLFVPAAPGPNVGRRTKRRQCQRRCDNET